MCGGGRGVILWWGVGGGGESEGEKREGVQYQASLPFPTTPKYSILKKTSKTWEKIQTQNDQNYVRNSETKMNIITDKLCVYVYVCVRVCVYV